MNGKSGWRLIGVGAMFCVAMVWGAARAQEAVQTGLQRSVAITVDDLPGALPGNDFAYGELKELQKINRGIPAVLKAHHAWAIGFVNERKLQVAGERDARAELVADVVGRGIIAGESQLCAR